MRSDKLKKVEKEVKVVEEVLGVIYRCLTLYKGLGDIRQCKAIVEKELRILIAEKDAEIVATREP